VTTTHYFVNGNRRVVVNRSSETTNIGFSVVAKVGVCDGTYGIIVEGPKQHPVSALLCMFDQVNRIGIWKPNMGPYCGNIRREHHKMFWHSHSGESGDIPPPPRPSNQ